MKCYLALFDPDFQAENRTYWTWHHPELTLDLLERFYSDVARFRYAADLINTLQSHTPPETVVVNAEWSCWFTVIDGGRDSKGRLGRRVLLALFMRELEAANQVQPWSNLEQNPQIKQIIQSAGERPVPKPTSLPLDLDGSTFVLPKNEVEKVAHSFVPQLRNTGHFTAEVTNSDGILNPLPPSFPNFEDLTPSPSTEFPEQTSDTNPLGKLVSFSSEEGSDDSVPAFANSWHNQRLNALLAVLLLFLLACLMVVLIFAQNF